VAPAAGDPYVFSVTYDNRIREDVAVPAFGAAADAVPDFPAEGSLVIDTPCTLSVPAANASPPFGSIDPSMRFNGADGQYPLMLYLDTKGTLTYEGTLQRVGDKINLGIAGKSLTYRIRFTYKFMGPVESPQSEDGALILFGDTYHLFQGRALNVSAPGSDRPVALVELGYLKGSPGNAGQLQDIQATKVYQDPKNRMARGKLVVLPGLPIPEPGDPLFTVKTNK
jgi:hypothetical protein